jgi:shikimate dehydrogenase
MITGTTRLYAIIGDPIAHVRTPIRFNERFKALGINAVCVPLLVPSADFDVCLAGLKAMPTLAGFIVTAPHKIPVMRYCDTIEPGARLVGAVNTVKRLPDGRYAGTMLDGHGFVAGLRAHGHDPAGRSVFIQGSGGAASAIGFSLAAAGVAEIRFRNRSVAHAEALAARVAAAFPACRAYHVDSPGDADIALNATPLGLEPDDPLPFDVTALRPDALVAEVLMQPATTRLLQEAQSRGHVIHGGRHMLDYQLDLMFEFLMPNPEVPMQDHAV